MKTILTEAEKEARKIERAAIKAAEKENNRIEAEKNQPKIKEITFNIEWGKRGSNPICTAIAISENKTGERIRLEPYISKCSGWGYDKESTVLASAFNQFLKYKLYGELLPSERRSSGTPYGIRINDNYRYYEGGVGVNCYYDIAKCIGGKFEYVASGNSFDVYKYTDLTENKQ
jgi:hypothetical protein